MVNRIVIKTSEEMKIMAEGGAKLARVKNSLKKEIKAGVNANDIESLATELIIKKEGAKPSFRMVPGYNWTTCVNINEVVVHGIPKKEIVFERCQNKIEIYLWEMRNLTNSMRILALHI